MAIFAAAFPPKRLHSISMHKKDTQLSAKPQSSARYLNENSSLLARRFIMMTLTTKRDVTRLGTLRRRIR